MKDRLIKVISWRILSIIITFILLFVLTGDIKSSTGVAVLLHGINTVAHFIFEIVWEGIYENR